MLVGIEFLFRIPSFKVWLNMNFWIFLLVYSARVEYNVYVLLASLFSSNLPILVGDKIWSSLRSFWDDGSVKPTWYNPLLENLL